MRTHRFCEAELTRRNPKAKRQCRKDRHVGLTSASTIKCSLYVGEKMR